MGKIRALVQRKGPWGSVGYLGHWCQERFFERWFAVSTSGFIPLVDLELRERRETCGDYEPVAYRAIFKALRALSLDWQNQVFIDYGSGKGRAVVVAATRPFKRIIGIEFSEELNRIARENVNRAKPRLRCNNVELVTIDAGEYQPPDDVTVIFLYNPFTGEIMSRVIDRLEESLKRVPRRMTILFRYPSWAEDPFASRSVFHLLKEQRGYSEAGEVQRIYGANP